MKLKKQLNDLGLTKRVIIPGLFMAVLVAAIFIQAAGIQKQTENLEVGAGAYNALMYIVPDSQFIESNTTSTFLVWIDSNDEEVTYVSFEVNFDPSLINLANDFIVTNNSFRVAKITETSLANSEGRVEVILALDPSNSPVRGNVELGRITLRSRTSQSNVNTSLSFNQSNIQVVHTSGTEYSISTRNSNITLNPEATPTPTPTSVSPTSTPKATPTPQPQATSTPVSGSTQPSHEQTVTGTSTSNTVSVSGLNAENGNLYLAAVSTKGFTRVNSVSGMGLTWSRVAAQCSARNGTMVEVWRAQGSPVSGTVTARLNSTPNNAVMAVSMYSEVHTSNPIGSIIAGNTHGINASCSGGTDTNTYSFDISTNPPVHVYAATAIRLRSHTPGSVFSELTEVHSGTGGAAAGLAVMDRGVTGSTRVPVTGTLDSTIDWAVIGVEIRGR